MSFLPQEELEDLLFYRDRFSSLKKGEKTKIVEHSNDSDSDVEIIGATEGY